MVKFISLFFVLFYYFSSYANLKCEAVFSEDYYNFHPHNSSVLIYNEFHLKNSYLLKRPNGDYIHFKDEYSQHYNKNMPTYILIHGLSKNHKHWDKVSNKLLASGARVIRPDLYNIGYSLHLSGIKKNHKIKSDAKMLYDLVSSLNLNNIILVGHSRGAGVSIELASMFHRTDVIKTAFLITPFVRDLAPYYKRKALQALQSSYSHSPWSYWGSYTKFLGINSDKEFKNGYSHPLITDMIERTFDHEKFNSLNNAIEYMKNRSKNEILSGIEIEYEASALREILNGIQNTSVLNAAIDISAKVHLLRATDDNVLVPKEIIAELTRLLQIEAELVEADHYITVKKPQIVVDWIYNNLE